MKNKEIFSLEYQKIRKKTSLMHCGSFAVCIKQNNFSTRRLYKTENKGNHAKEMGLKSADIPDSQEICFVHLMMITEN